MAKRQTPPPQRDPDGKVDQFLQRIRIIDLSKQGEALTRLFTDLADANSPDAIKVSAELRQLARDLSEEVFQSSLVLSSAAVFDFANEFVALVNSLLTPQCRVAHTLDVVKVELAKLKRIALPDAERDLVRACIGAVESVADEVADPILDVQFALEDLQKEIKNEPGQTWEGLKRTWAKLARAKPEKR